MKQTLLALAVTAGLGAFAEAHAQASSVQVYGLIDLRVDSMKFSSNTAGTISGMRKEHVFANSNRWGLRGTENLGGGMAAIFQVEAQMFTDGRPLAASDSNGAGFLGGRDSFLGLRGNWGQVQAGGFGSAYKDVPGVWSVLPTLDHTGIVMGNGDTTGAAPSPNCTGVVSGAGVITAAPGQACLPSLEGNGTSFNRRLADHIQYTSPQMGGFRIKIGQQIGDYAEPSSATPAGTSQFDPQLTALSVLWSGGPISIAGAYEVHRGFRATNAAGSNRNARDDGITLGARWNYGAGLIGAGWERLKYGNASTAAAPNDFTLTNWVLNATYNVGPNGVVGLGYSKTGGAQDCGAGLSSTAVVPTCGGGTGASMVSLAYDHRLSKRTALYAAYGRINNNAGAAYYYVSGPQSNLGGGSVGGVAAGTDVTTYAMGVKHTF